MRPMRTLFSRLMIISAAICMTACASTQPSYNHLDAGARQHIKTVDSVLVAKQKKIGADITQSSQFSQIAAVAQGSVLPIMIDAGIAGIRTIKANSLAKPMRETLEEHDFPWEFRKQVKYALANSELDGVEDFTIVRGEYPGFRSGYIEDSEADAVLFVDMKYAFTPKFDNLYVTSLAILFPNTPELRPFQERPDRDNVIEFSDNIYRNQFVALVPTPLKDGSKSENAAFWAELSEEELTNLLHTAGLLLSDKMANDIGIDDLNSDLDLIPEGYVFKKGTHSTSPPAAKLRSAPEDIEAVADNETVQDIEQDIEAVKDGAAAEDFEAAVDRKVEPEKAESAIDTAADAIISDALGSVAAAETTN